MIREKAVIDCKKDYPDTKMANPFVVVKYTFNYESGEDDQCLINRLIGEGTNLADKVNPGAANDAKLKRSYDRILCNCIAGVLSEYLWKNLLNIDGELVKATEMKEARSQIDLEVISNKKKIEVRSSFPRNGIPFAICHACYQFDIIGPYSNGYKPGEIQKDYYLRALFKLSKPTDLLAEIKRDGFEAFLTGGATWAMMADDRVAIEKDFVPEDEMYIGRMSARTKYRVVPYNKAFNTVQIFNLIKTESNT
jgi:hypothetical protein